MIIIENLQKNYGKTRALAGIDLTVKRGELFGFLGPNGAGKSTTIRILTGLTKMGGGRARLGGFDIEKNPTAAKQQFGVVHQYINLDQELTVFENLDIHGRLFNMEKKVRILQIRKLLDAFELGDRTDSLVKQLSGGLKRRVTIARAMLHNPSILFLDEPTVGLDARIRRKIWGLIKTIQQQGTTIFLTTHHIEEAEILAHRVAFLDKGKIVALNSPARLMARVGTWAIDEMQNNTMVTRYFDRRKEADNFRSDDGFTLRRVNLEDAFLALTGRKVT
jgi:ABC-2 type transport system ATP-binding protein